MRNKFILLWLVCCILSFTAKSQIQNGTFDVSPVNLCYTTPGGWTTSSGGVQWTNIGNPTYWIDLTDCGYGNGRWIEQKFATNQGSTYSLTMDVGAWQWTQGGVNVYIDGMMIATLITPNDGVTPLLWANKSTSFVAATCSTTVRIECNSPDGPIAAVVGLDNVVATELPVATVDITPNLTITGCAPAIVSFPENIPGTITWYRNGVPHSTGGNSTVAMYPGTYRVEIITDCEAMINEIVVPDCDDCMPFLRVANNCADQTTFFTLDLSTTSCAACNLTIISVDYGDNSPPSTSMSHTYALPGTYNVEFCWYDDCTQTNHCTIKEVVIKENCDNHCEPYIDVAKGCVEKPYVFTLSVPQECEQECILLKSIVVEGINATITYPVTGQPAVPGVIEFETTFTYPGIYHIRICWINLCTLMPECITRTIYVEDCDEPCTPELTITKLCIDGGVDFDIRLPEGCEPCEGSTWGVGFGDGNGQTGPESGGSFTYNYTTPGPYSIIACFICGDKVTCVYRHIYVYTGCDNDNERMMSVGTEKEMQMNIYPNPADKFFTVVGIEQGAIIEIYDLSGKRLLQQKATKDAAGIDITTLTPGVYIVKVNSNNIVEQFKLIKH